MTRSRTRLVSIEKNLGKYLPIILTILLYLLIYLLRLQQAGGFVHKSLSGQTDQGLFLTFRENLDKKIGQYLPSPQAELLSGILLGRKPGSSQQTPKSSYVALQLAMRDTSTIHMLVVSGQNLTMLSGLVMGMLAGLLHRRLAILISLGTILFYTLLTGGQIPVIRAAIMASLAFGAQFFGRQSQGFWFLTMAGGAMLLYNPNWLLDLSFQLSFLATFGVIVVSPILESKLTKIPLFLRQDLAVTIGAQLLVLPLLSQTFHQISLVAIFANLLVGPAIPVIMMLGTLMLLAGFVWATLAVVIGDLTNLFLTYFVYIVTFFANLPFAWEYIGQQSWLVWVGYYCLLGAVILAVNIDGRY